MYESAQIRALSSIHQDLKPGALGKGSTEREVVSLSSTPGTHLIFHRAGERGGRRVLNERWNLIKKLKTRNQRNERKKKNKKSK